MPSYMVCSLSGRWEVLKILCHAPHYLAFIIIICIIMTMNSRMTKKAALGGPSSEDTFPLREKTKF